MLCVVLTRKMRYSSIYFITRKYKTDMPFCTIRPAGLGGQIEHQTRLGQFSQFGRAQHSSGNGVGHQIERGEVAGQEAPAVADDERMCALNRDRQFLMAS